MRAFDEIKKRRWEQVCCYTGRSLMLATFRREIDARAAAKLLQNVSSPAYSIPYPNETN